MNAPESDDLAQRSEELRAEMQAMFAGKTVGMFINCQADAVATARSSTELCDTLVRSFDAVKQTIIAGKGWNSIIAEDVGNAKDHVRHLKLLCLHLCARLVDLTDPTKRPPEDAQADYLDPASHYLAGSIAAPPITASVELP